MDDVTLSLIVIVVTGMLVAGIFWIYQRRKAQRAEQLRQAALQRGWRLERIQQPLRSGYQVEGTAGGIRWSLESLAQASAQEAGPGSSSVSRFTQWQTTEVRLPGRLVLIGPRPQAGATPNFGGFGNMLVQAGLQAMLGADAGKLSGLSEVQAGSPELQKQAMIWAHKQQDARQLLGRGVESALLAWPFRPLPVIKLTPEKLIISLNDRQLEQESELAALVGLGERLAGAWQAGENQA